MHPRLAHLLVCLYPHAWRERYGAEFEAFLQAGDSSFRTGANVAWEALCEHIFPTQRREVDQQRRYFGAIAKLPSAFLPLTMSLTALAMVLGDVAIYGIVHQADEGTFGDRFGDELYSKEELVAEMGAAFLCAIADIANERTDRNTTAYIQNWIEKLEEDNRLIVHAAANAQRAGLDSRQHL